MNTSLFRNTLLALAALALPHTANASLLIGYYNFPTGNPKPDNTPDANTAPGDLSASVNATGASNADGSRGSQDGFYGPDGAGYGGITTGPGDVSPPPGTVYNGRVDAAGAKFSITNSPSSTTSYVLGSLLFDMAASNNLNSVFAGLTYQIDSGSIQQLLGAIPAESKVKGAAASGVPATIVNTYVVGTVGDPQNYTDFIADLTGVTLGIGQTIVFTWTTGSQVRLDNIALTAIPEPASLIALACVLGSGLFLRQRPRQFAPSLA